MIPTRTNTCFSANKWAVEQDIHSDQLDEFGTTALIYAVSDRHTDIVELLLHAGANLEIVSTSPSDDASWRDAGVVIIGSGFTTHNLREARFGDVSGSAPEWGREFDLWAKETVEGGDIDAILDFEHTAPAALIAHPRTEHFAPLFVSLGAVADAKVDAVSAVDGFWYGLAKRSFQFN